MSHRFFVPTPIAGSRVDLIGDEARHLAAVMRAQAGDEIVLFDGSGAEFIARVVAVRKHSVELDIALRREPLRELPLELTLAVALPKGDRQKWLIEKATELGVTRIVPLITQRGVAQPVESALDRLRRSVIEASKQCGRNWLMTIDEPLPAGEFFESAAQSATRLLAHPTGQSLAQLAATGSATAAISIAVGPEGGFTDEEIAAASAAGWQVVTLGPRILRVETAAIALAAWAGLQAGQTARV